MATPEHELKIVIRGECRVNRVNSIYMNSRFLNNYEIWSKTEVPNNWTINSASDFVNLNYYVVSWFGRSNGFIIR